jgi:outer membrane biosynthesis protein TonB
MTEEQEEKKNKRIALLSTIGIQALVVLLLFLIIAWRPPNPPLPEYGIELNFGLDTEGSGEIQPESPVGNDGAEAEDEAAQPTPAEAAPEEPNEVVPEETKPVETKPTEQQVISKVESPVTVKEKKEEVKPVEKPKEIIPEKKVGKKVETKPTVDSKAVYKPNKQPSQSDSPGAKEGKPGNHGDDPGKTGDKGSPQGTTDAKALYGQPGGGGGGPAFSGFDGFKFPEFETPPLPDESFGIYEFKVIVDGNGDVLSVTPIRRGTSLAAEQKLKAVIQKLVFEPKGTNLPPQSEGRITFRVVSK